MKCPQCGNNILTKQLNNINELLEHYELRFTNKCRKCGYVFDSMATARIESEKVLIIDGEKVNNDA